MTLHGWHDLLVTLLIAAILFVIIKVGLSMTKARAWQEDSREESRELSRLNRLIDISEAILDRLTALVPFPTAIAITQLQGDFTMAITGIQLGAVGTFAETPTPAGSAFPSGTTFTWSSDDTLTTLTPSADGTQVAVATVAGDTAPSFNLTCTSSFTPPGGAGPVASTVNVPLLPAAVQTPTGIDINQLS